MRSCLLCAMSRFGPDLKNYIEILVANVLDCLSQIVPTSRLSPSAKFSASAYRPAVREVVLESGTLRACRLLAPAPSRSRGNCVVSDAMLESEKLINLFWGGALQV